MKIVDAVMILLLLLGAVIGFKKGFIKTMVSLVGIFLVLILTIYLKKPVVSFMYSYFPFFNYGGYSVLNILIYESIAFLLIFILLSSILGILINISGVVEKVLNATILLGIISKILGAIAGILEMLLFIFVGLFVCARISYTAPYINESKATNIILAKTPVIGSLAAPSYVSLSEINNLKSSYEGDIKPEQFNLDALMILVRYNIVSKDQARQFIADGKIKIENPESFILV